MANAGRGGRVRLVLAGRNKALTANRNQIATLLTQVLSQNDYVYLLAQHVEQVGIRVDGIVLLLDLDADTGRVSLSVCEAPSQARPCFWVECGTHDLEASLRGERVTDLVIQTGAEGQTVHPRLERVLHRCFQPPPYPVEDREELIYPALFGFEPPNVLWHARQSTLKVLHYPGRRREPTITASSGLSDPGGYSPANPDEGGVAGAGYELIINTPQQPVVSEFVKWARYVEQTGTHIVPGNWLELDEGNVLPGTKVGGFLVLTPSTLPESFPVGSSRAYWHLVVPVSPAQLALAKRTDVFQVAKKIKREIL